MNKISLITDLGVEEFTEKDKSQINTLLKERKTYITTEEGKEYLGIYITFDNRWQSIKLQAIEGEVVVNIPLNKILQIYQ